MNRSGGPTTNLLKFYGLTIADLIVVHDELDIPAMDVRLKQGGGHGGHNGLRDIVAAIGTPDFIRVRVGIGRPPGRQDAADFVLQDFGKSERDVLPHVLARGADIIESIVTSMSADGVVNYAPMGVEWDEERIAHELRSLLEGEPLQREAGPARVLAPPNRERASTESNPRRAPQNEQKGPLRGFVQQPLTRGFSI